MALAGEGVCSRSADVRLAAPSVGRSGTVPGDAEAPSVSLEKGVLDNVFNDFVPNRTGACNPYLSQSGFFFFFFAFAFVRGLLLLLVVLQYSGEALFQGAVAMYPPRHVLK